MSEAGTSLRPGAVTRAAEPVVRCEALTVRFVGREGTVRAVNGVDFTLDAGEVLCIVGESGAGKSVALRAVMRLLPAHITDISGTITIAGKDVMGLDRRALGDLRGAEVHRLQRELQIAVLFVTHDVGVAVEMSDRIAVMYAAASSRRDRCARSFAIRND